MQTTNPTPPPRTPAPLPSPYRARRTKHGWLSLQASFIAPNIFALLASVILIEATNRVSYGLVLYCSLVSVIIAIHHRPLTPGERGEKPRTPNRLARIRRARPILDLHWHDLRHTFGTRLGEAGFSDSTIAELMGHSSVTTTRRYTHGTENAKRAAVEAARMGAGNSRPKYAPNEKQPAIKLAVSH